MNSWRVLSQDASPAQRWGSPGEPAPPSPSLLPSRQPGNLGKAGVPALLSPADQEAGN